MICHNYIRLSLKNVYTELFIWSVAMFCNVFRGELRGPAWAVGSYSISRSARETYQTIIFKTLRLIGRPALYLVLNGEGGRTAFDPVPLLHKNS